MEVKGVLDGYGYCKRQSVLKIPGSFMRANLQIGVDSGGCPAALY